MRCITTVISLTLLSLAWATPLNHDAAGPLERRSETKRFGFAARTALPRASGTAGECEPGQWQCAGEAISNCLHGAWNTLITCSGETRCSDGTDGTPPGCVWKTTGEIATIAPTDSSGPTSSDDVASTSSATIEPTLEPTLDPFFMESYGQHNAVLEDQGGVVRPPGPSDMESASVISPVLPPASSEVTSSTSIAPPINSGSPQPGPGGPSGSFSSPHIVIYMENTNEFLNSVRTNWPRAEQLLPINRVLLSFWTTDQGMTRMPMTWFQNLTDSERQEIRADYKANGIALMLSLFGALNTPTTAPRSGDTPEKVAQDAAEAVKSNGFDGVDVNYEDPAMATEAGVTWVIAFQKELRRLLPPPYLISHAPHFGPSWAGGGYQTVHEQVGSGIDWYNIHYYNQGDNAFADVASLVDSCGGTAISELMAAGYPADKLVIGKPAKEEHVVNSGLVDASTFAGIVSAAKAKGWNAGIMAWQWSLRDAQTFMKTAWGA